jgi:hypothetical protein
MKSSSSTSHTSRSKTVGDRVVEHLAPGDSVAFVGPPSRTWYRDLSLLQRIISDLHTTLGIQVVHTGDLPFALHVVEFCDAAGVPHTCWCGNDLMGVHLLVAFPDEDWRAGPPGVQGGYESADPYTVEMLHGYVPTLVVYRSGRMEWKE